MGPKSGILVGAAVWLRLVSLSLEKGLPDPGTQIAEERVSAGCC